MCGFIAQLVEHRTGIAEVTGSNPVEALIFFFQASSFQLLKLENSLQGSFFTIISLFVKITQPRPQVSLQNRRDFLRILGKQRRKRGEREASAKREWRARGGALKTTAAGYGELCVWFSRWGGRS